jgi:hypothetical protein
MFEPSPALLRPSLNHSYVCAQLMRQLLCNESIQALPELISLDIENGFTPNISVFPKNKIQPDFFEDVLKVTEMPILAIKIVSPTQSIHTLITKSKSLLLAGVKTVFHCEVEGIRADFSLIFG